MPLRCMMRDSLLSWSKCRRNTVCQSKGMAVYLMFVQQHSTKIGSLGAPSFLALDADGITRADDRGLWFFIDVEAEDVWPRIVTHGIEVVFATCDIC